MRRLSLVLSAIVLVAIMSFGQSQKVDLVSDINFERLSRYLQLKSSQVDEVAIINDYFNIQLEKAVSIRKSIKLYMAT